MNLDPLLVSPSTPSPAANTKEFLSRRAGLVMATGFLCFAPGTQAAIFTWNGGGNGNFGGGANWTTNVAPPNDGTADLVFSGSNQFSPNAQLPYSINTLLFSNISSIVPFSITGEKITFTTNGGTQPFIRNETAYANSLSNIIEFQNDGTIRAQSGNLTFSNTFITGPAGGGGHTVNFTADSGRTINLGTIGGTGNLRTLGNGTIRLNGATIISGTLDLGGTVEVDATIAGPPSINVGGTVRLLSANRISSVPIAVAGNLNLQGYQETLGPLSGGGNISLGTNGDLRVDQNSATTFNGTILGIGLSNIFRKEGSGVLSLGGTSTFIGTTTVAEGTLRLLSGTAIAPFADLTISGGAKLDLNTEAISIPTLTGAGTLGLPGPSTLEVGGLNGNFTFGGLCTGSGNLTKVGTGVMQLTGTANSAVFSGTLNVLAGVVEARSNNTLGTTTRVTVANGATLQLLSGQFQSFNGGVSLAGSGTGGVGALKISSEGSGLTSIAGAITLLGDSTIVSDADPASDLSLASIALGNRSLTTQGTGDVRFGLGLVGAGALILNGGATNELNGDNTAHTGPIQVNSGTLDLNSDRALGGGTQPVGVAAARALRLRNDVDISTSRLLDLDGDLVIAENADATWSGSGAVEMSFGSRLFLDTNSTFNWSGSGVITAVDGFRVDMNAGTSLTLSRNIISPNGIFQFFGVGSILLNGTVTNNSGVVFNNGTITLGAANRISDSTYLNIGAEATLRLNNFSEKTAGLQGAGTVDLGSGTLTLTPFSNADLHTHSGNITGSGNVIVEANNAGRRQIFSTANSYTGSTTVRNGAVLEVGAAGALSQTARLTVSNGGELRLGATGQAVGSLAGDGKIVHTSASALLVVGSENPSTLWSGTIEGPGGLMVNAASGSVIMTAPQSYTGGTTLVNGTLVSSGLAASDVTIDATATFSALGKHAGVECAGLIRNHFFGNTINTNTLLLTAGSTVEMSFNSWDAEPAIATESLTRLGGSVILTGQQLPPLSPGEVKVIRVVDADQFSGSSSNIQVSLAGDLAGFAGTVQARIQGNHLEVVLTAPGNVDYFHWIAGFAVGNEDDSTDDPDRDGIANGVEYVLGGNPAAAVDSNLLPTLQDDGTHIIFSYRRMKRSIYLGRRVEYSLNLEPPWTRAMLNQGGVTIYDTPVDASLDVVNVRIPKSGATRFFVRLGVIVPTPN